MEKLKKIVGNNLFIFNFLVHHIPLYVILTIVLYVAKGLLQSFSNVWLVERVIDGISSDNTYSSIIAPVVFFSIYALLVGFFNGMFLEITEKIYKQKFTDKMRMLLYKKAIECDINQYDSIEFYNNFIWSAKEIDNRSFAVFQSIVMFVQRITVISSTIIFLTSMNKWILIAVVISCIVNFYFTIKQNKVQFELSKQMNFLARKRGYVGRVVHSPEYAKELRTSKIGEVLLSMYYKTTDEMESEIKTKSKPLWRYELLKKGLGEDIFVTLISVLVLSWQVLRETISIGTFVASYNGVQIIYSSLSFILGRAASFSDSSLYIEKFKSFWFYTPCITSDAEALIPHNTESLKFDNVSFFYENTSRQILRDISFEFGKPQKIAIVGSNGAGKTTLIKILLRLYDAKRGFVLHNNVDVKKLDLGSYRKTFSCLFQDFNLYACSLGENIAMNSAENINKQKLSLAISNSGFEEKFESFTNGIGTPITKEFDNSGIILSGGEKQKLAIARVLYQDADCYILDEPTAALDPTAEAEFNHKIMEYSEEKLLIIISHRLTITRFVDTIIVLDNGEICELGSHADLIQKGGRYARLYEMQSSQYWDTNR